MTVFNTVAQIGCPAQKRLALSGKLSIKRNFRVKFHLAQNFLPNLFVDAPPIRRLTGESRSMNFAQSRKQCFMMTTTEILEHLFVWRESEIFADRFNNQNFSERQRRHGCSRRSSSRTSLNTVFKASSIWQKTVIIIVSEVHRKTCSSKSVGDFYPQAFRLGLSTFQRPIFICTRGLISCFY